MKRHLRKLTAVLLVMTLICSIVAPASAARLKKYVSDLKISYDYDGPTAKQVLVDQGYTVVEQDLNEDADNLLSKSRVVYIGYKTTTDPTEAITDMAMMSEECGYSFSDYQQILKKQFVQYEILAEREMVIIEEFRQNFWAGKPFAVVAYNSLNNFMEDDSGKLVGDYFLDESLTKEDMLKFMTQISQMTLSAFNSLLSSGIAETTEDTFLTRLSALSNEEIAACKKETDLHADAMLLYDQVKPFQEQMRRTQSYIDSINAMTEEEIAAKEDDEEFQQEMYEQTTNIYMYGLLHQTMYGDKPLYDLIMQGQLDVRELYPLVKVMTKAQIYAVSFIGFTSLLKSTIPVTQEQVGAVEEEISTEDEAKPEVVSAYLGVDREMFTDAVAVTSNATRTMNATNDKSAMYGVTESPTQMALLIATGVSAGTAVVAALAVVGLKYYLSGITNTGRVNALVKFFNPKFAIEMVKTVFRNTGVWGYRALTAFGVAAASVTLYVALIAAAVVSIVLVVLHYYNKYNPTYSKVPKILLDLVEGPDSSEYIRYDAVLGQDDNPGDLNGFANLKWNALYVTKDPAAGKPILADALTSFDSTTVKENNYKAVHEFGATTAVNLNNYAFNGSAKPIYLYFSQDLRYSPTATTASVFGGVISPLITGLVGLMLGFAGCFVMFKRKKRISVS